MIQLWQGDCLIRLKDFPDDSVGSFACDPPYELLFMSKGWDGTGIAFNVNLWKEIYRALKPGGVATVKAFSGTRTFHRMAVAMEESGFSDIQFEAWNYGSGFPKSLNVGKAMDKMAGAIRAKRKVPYSGNAVLRSGGQNTRPWMEEALKVGYHELADDTAMTDNAKRWTGYGSALKPAWEPILVGRKP